MEIRHSFASEVFEQRETVIARGFTAKNYSIQMHDHDFYEVNIVLSGSGVHRIAGTSIPTTVGDVFVIPPGLIHGWGRESEDFDVYHIIFKEEFFKRYADEISTFSGFRLLFEVEPMIRGRSGSAYLTLGHGEMEFLLGTLRLFESLRDVTTAEADTLRSTLALTAIGYLSGCATGRRNSPVTGKADFEMITASLEYIHNHLDEKLTVSRLADMAGMSRATFLRRFKDLCMTTPHEYIMRRRITEAERLLRSGLSATAVAQECGFYDAAHLYKTLKK